MSESMQMWVEIAFNVAYLLVVWGLVVTMVRRREVVRASERRAASLVRWAFGLLALGDTGHVGFRVAAYAMGGLERRVDLFGGSLGFVGLGTLSTSITVTLFYVLMLELWRTRFGRQYCWFSYLLLGAGVVRLALMTLPGNAWDSLVPPQPWSTARNLPLTLLGLGVAGLMLRDGRAAGDRTFKWIGGMILVSFACYLPVIFFVQRAPLVGMLMIPKTLAYVAIGFLAYADLYRGPELESTSAPVASA